MKRSIKNLPHTGGAAVEETYDAFLSYSSKDAKVVRRLQRFLQSFRRRMSDGTNRRVRVYLDYTDIRGGDLSGARSEIELAGQPREGETIMRVDETIFRSGQRPLWRRLVEP